MKKTCLNLFLVSISLSISIILFEFSLRIILPIYDPRGMLDVQYYPQDDVILCRKNFLGRQWKNTGDYNVPVAINKYGFRDQKDIALSTAKDIFVAGDSFGLGWGVAEKKRFSNLLESILGIPVYNISSPAGDITNYQKLLNYAQKEGAKIENLILAICMENDLRDYDPEVKTQPEFNPTFPDKKPFPLRPSFYSKFTRMKNWLAKNSAAYQAFTVLMHQNSSFRKMALKTGLIIDNYAGMQRNVYSERALASTAKRLFELSKPFNTLIMLIPSRGLWAGENRQVELAAHHKLVALLKELGIKVIDLRSDFQETGNPLQHYFKNDGHWNEKGHLRAAKAIVEFIKQNNNLYSLAENRYN